MFDVLAIDDDVFIGDFIRTTFEDSGFSVRVALSALDGVSEFQRGPPHIILTDIDMPGMDGFELMARIRTEPCGATIPIMALTGRDAADVWARGRAFDLKGVLSKPINRGALVRGVLEVLTGPA